MVLTRRADCVRRPPREAQAVWRSLGSRRRCRSRSTTVAFACQDGKLVTARYGQQPSVLQIDGRLFVSEMRNVEVDLKRWRAIQTGSVFAGCSLVLLQAVIFRNGKELDDGTYVVTKKPLPVHTEGGGCHAL